MIDLSPVLTELLATMPVPAGAVIDTGAVSYELDGTALEGYLALDAASDEPRPGVLVIHDWLGVGGYVQVRAQMLARLGYVALAADIYGADLRPGPQEAPRSPAGSTATRRWSGPGPRPDSSSCEPIRWSTRTGSPSSGTASAVSSRWSWPAAAPTSPAW